MQSTQAAEPFKHRVSQVTCSPFLNCAVGFLNLKGEYLSLFCFTFLDSLCHLFLLKLFQILFLPGVVFTSAACSLSGRSLINSSLCSHPSLWWWIGPLENNGSFGQYHSGCYRPTNWCCLCAGPPGSWDLVRGLILFFPFTAPANSSDTFTDNLWTGGCLLKYSFLVPWFAGLGHCFISTWMRP